MLDAYIIEKLKHEEEEREREREQWQPIPLPLEEYERRDPIERKKKERDIEDPRGAVIIQLQSCKDSVNFLL